LVYPDKDTLQKTVGHVRKSQYRRNSKNSIFVPDAVGALVRPDRSNRIYSNSCAAEGKVYDVPSLESKFIELETAGVLSCGVATVHFADGSRMLVHGAFPQALKTMVARGIEIVGLDAPPDG